MLLERLDILYEYIAQTNLFFRVLRYWCRISTNLYVLFFMGHRQRNMHIGSDSIIVSLTSYPARIKKVWMTCATLLNQNAEYIHVILWLSREQFPAEFDSLPGNLLKLRAKGLDIRFVDDDLRPHKKYFYAMQEFPDNDVVTVDDDILYNPNLVDALQKCHQKHQDCVICNRGTIVARDSYKNWKPNDKFDEERNDIMPTGIGGVYYPAHIFDNTPIFNKEAIKETCINGDDLWLNFMTRYKGKKVVQTGFKTGLITVLSSQNSALCNENIGENRNDLQIIKLSHWAESKLGCDFFVNID